jgi:hypothetical protein
MPEVIPVETYHDLVSDDHLGLAAADAIAGDPTQQHTQANDN